MASTKTNTIDNLKNARIAVRENGLNLQFCNSTFQNDYRVVIDAVTQNGLALKFASERWRNNNMVVSNAVLKNGLALEFVSPEYQNENGEEHAFIAVKQNGLALRFVKSSNFIELNFKDLVMIAVKQNGLAIHFAPRRLQTDQDVIDAALEQNSAIFSKVVGDVINIVSHCGILLKVQSDKNRDNKDIVIAAVKNDGDAIQFASDKLKKNIHIVMIALKQKPSAIEHIDKVTKEKLKATSNWSKVSKASLPPLDEQSFPGSIRGNGPMTGVFEFAGVVPPSEEQQKIYDDITSKKTVKKHKTKKGIGRKTTKTQKRKKKTKTNR